MKSNATNLEFNANWSINMGKISLLISHTRTWFTILNIIDFIVSIRRCYSEYVSGYNPFRLILKRRIDIAKMRLNLDHSYDNYYLSCLWAQKEITSSRSGFCHILSSRQCSIRGELLYCLYKIREYPRCGIHRFVIWA